MVTDGVLCSATQALLTLQVTPTVGVHADDASGKKSANMQKHFRHLVNETASKQRFLRSLHRTNSAREGSGSMPTVLEQQTSVKGESGVDSSCDQETSAQQEPTKGAAPVNIKTEMVIKEEPESGCPGSEAAGAVVNGEVHLSIADSACLPESLGEELGHAACLKADPDSLMADALPPSGTLSVAPTDVVDLSAVDARQALESNQTAPHQAPADYSEVVREFLDILGEAVDAETARGFVARAGGRLAAAINSYYDSADVMLDSSPVHATAEVRGAGQQASSSETSAKSVTHSLAQSADTSAAVDLAEQQASHEPFGKQLGRGKKRNAAPQVRADDKLTKKQKSASTAQRSIATFFGARQPSMSHKPAKGAQQTPDRPTGHASARRGVLVKPAQEGLTSPQQGVKSPCQGVKPPEQEVKLHESTLAAPARATPAASIDLAAASVKNHADADDADVAHTEQARTIASSQAVPPPSSLFPQVFSGHDVGGSERVEGAPPVQPPVHPFFGKSTRQVKKTPAKALDHAGGDRAATLPGQDRGSTKGPSPQSEGKLSMLKEEQTPVNKPITKAQAEPSKDVPADAVLLPTSEYDPVKMAVWEAGQATPYRHISRAFQAMESTTKRLRIGDAIANMFRSILALSPGTSTTVCNPVLGQKLTP